MKSLGSRLRNVFFFEGPSQDTCFPIFYSVDMFQASAVRDSLLLAIGADLASPTASETSGSSLQDKVSYNAS